MITYQYTAHPDLAEKALEAISPRTPFLMLLASLLAIGGCYLVVVDSYHPLILGLLALGLVGPLAWRFFLAASLRKSPWLKGQHTISLSAQTLVLEAHGEKIEVALQKARVHSRPGDMFCVRSGKWMIVLIKEVLPIDLQTVVWPKVCQIIEPLCHSRQDNIVFRRPRLVGVVVGLVAGWLLARFFLA